MTKDTKAKDKKQILLTNDDGIRSPGLWAAASILESIGFVTVAAPREQSSGMGRSLPRTSDGIISTEQVTVNGKKWQVYAIGGTPAQAVLHGALEVMPSKPDLVVSGINYGENVGSGVTISGTVGAALEAASLGIPALAVSLQTSVKEHLSYSQKVDFSTAAYFTGYFARLLLTYPMPDDVHILKVDIPQNATPETPWKITKISQIRYYDVFPPKNRDWNNPARINYRMRKDWKDLDPGSDAYTLQVLGLVSVTPMSLDMTSRINLQDFEEKIKSLT